MHVDGNYRVEIYKHLLDPGTAAKNATLGPWRESNLRPCDSGAALEPTELQRSRFDGMTLWLELE